MARREVIITRRGEGIPLAKPIPAPVLVPPPAPPVTVAVDALRPCGHRVTKRTDCGDCKTTAHNLAQMANAKRRPPVPLAARERSFRLPHGARVEATYNATTETWAASLTVGDEVLNGNGAAIHPLLMWLGRRYATAHPAVAP